MQGLLYLISVKANCLVLNYVEFFNSCILSVWKSRVVLSKQSWMHDSVTKVLFVDEVMV